MKDKLRELAERWKAEYSGIAGAEIGTVHVTQCTCATELLAILDAEGEGGAVQIPELRIGAPAWPGQLEGKAPPEGWVHVSVNNLAELPHPARSGVVSDEDVEAACRVNYESDGNSKWDKLAKCWKVKHRMAMRAALEHFAKGERHER